MVSMGLETRISMELDIVPSLDEVASIIDDLRNANLNLNRGELIDYLNSAYGLIDRVSADSEEVRRHYLTSVAIHAFAYALLGLNVPESMRDGFARLAERKYGIKRPFEVYFKGVDFNQQRFLREFKKRGELTQIVAQSPPRGFGTDFSIARMLRELRTLSNQLKGKENYERDKHLTFDSLLNVGLPLLGAHNRERSLFYEDYERLRGEYGEFVFLIPDFT